MTRNKRNATRLISMILTMVFFAGFIPVMPAGTAAEGDPYPPVPEWPEPFPNEDVYGLLDTGSALDTTAMLLEERSALLLYFEGDNDILSEGSIDGTQVQVVPFVPNMNEEGRLI
jgi:hypothetical protein